MPFRFTACASNARLEHHAPKENKVKRKLPYKLLKTVCYRVFKSLQHWLAGRLFDANMVLRQHHLLNGWSSTVGKLPRWSPEVPGHTQDGPRAQSSRVQGAVEILTLLSAEAQPEFLPSFCPLCALPHHHLPSPPKLRFAHMGGGGGRQLP